MNLATLGLIFKSGNMVYGFDSVKAEIQDPDSPIAGILLSCDLSPKTKKEIFFLRNSSRPELEIVETLWDMEQIGKTAGKGAEKRIGVAAIMDRGFWKSINKDNSVRGGTPSL